MDESKNLADVTPVLHDEGNRLFGDTLDASAISSNSATLGIKNWLFLPNTTQNGQTIQSQTANESMISQVIPPELNQGNMQNSFRLQRQSESQKQWSPPANNVAYKTDQILNSPFPPLRQQNQILGSGRETDADKNPYGTPTAIQIHPNLSSGRSLSTSNLPAPHQVAHPEASQGQSQNQIQGEVPSSSNPLTGGPYYSQATLKYLNRFGGMSSPSIPAGGTDPSPRGSVFGGNRFSQGGLSLTALAGLASQSKENSTHRLPEGYLAQGISGDVQRTQSASEPKSIPQNMQNNTGPGPTRSDADTNDLEGLTRAAGISEHLGTNNPQGMTVMQDRQDGESDPAPILIKSVRSVPSKLASLSGQIEAPAKPSPFAKLADRAPTSQICVFSTNPIPLSANVLVDLRSQVLFPTETSPAVQTHEYTRSYGTETSAAFGVKDKVVDVKGRSSGAFEYGFGMVQGATDQWRAPDTRLSHTSADTLSEFPVIKGLKTNFGSKLPSRNSMGDLFQNAFNVRDMAKLLPSNNLYIKANLQLGRQLRDRLKFSCGYTSLFESTLQDWEKDPGVADITQELGKTVTILRNKLLRQNPTFYTALDGLMQRVADTRFSPLGVPEEVAEIESQIKVPGLGVQEKLLIRRLIVIKNKNHQEANIERFEQLSEVDLQNQAFRLSSKESIPISSLARKKLSTVQGATRKLATKDYQRLISIHKSRFDEIPTDDEEPDQLPSSLVSQIEPLKSLIEALHVPESNWSSIVDLTLKSRISSGQKEPLHSLGRAHIQGQAKNPMRTSTDSANLGNMILATQNNQLKSAHTMSMRHLDYPNPQVQNQTQQPQTRTQIQNQPEPRTFGSYEYGRQEIQQTQTQPLRMQSAERLPERQTFNRTGSDSKQPVYRSLMKNETIYSNRTVAPNTFQVAAFQTESTQNQNARKVGLSVSARPAEGSPLSGFMPAPGHSSNQQQQQIASPASPPLGPTAYHRQTGSGSHYMPLSSAQTSNRVSAPQQGFVPLSQAQFRQPTQSQVTQKAPNNNPQATPQPIVIRGSRSHWFTG